jgi:hypothetical protein
VRSAVSEINKLRKPHRGSIRGAVFHVRIRKLPAYNSKRHQGGLERI